MFTQSEVDGIFEIDWNIFDSKAKRISDLAKTANHDDILHLAYIFNDLWYASSRRLFDVLGTCETETLLEKFSSDKNNWPDDSVDLFIEQILPIPGSRIKIYRGGVGNIEELKKGYSWTIDVNAAIEFRDKYINGIIIEAIIEKSDILFVSYLQAEIVPRRSALHDIHLHQQRFA